MTGPGPPIRSAHRVNVAEVLLDNSGRSAPSLPAVRFPGGEWSREELSIRVGRFAGVLRDQGVQTGDRVALALPDSPDWVVAFLAITRVGGIAALVPGALPDERRSDAIRRAEPTFVVTNDRGLTPELECLCPRELEGDEGTDPGPAATRGDDPAYMLLTSGSTGLPKWAIHRQRDIPCCIATYGRHVLRLAPGDVTYSTASLASSYGLGNSLYFPLGAGATAWIDGAKPSPAQAAAACVEGEVTVMLGVPTFWARLAQHLADGRVVAEAFADVRLAVSAGEPLPTQVFEAVNRHLGRELVDGLGSSEATNLYISNRPRRARRGRVGYPVPGFEVRVCDLQDRPVGTGMPGQLLVRGGSIMAGYLGDDRATAQALAGGWLHTGDLVLREPDGAYRFLGRIGDRFKAGGLLVDPHRVADALREHRGVAELYVLGVADSVGITRVVAVVASVPEVDAAQLECELALIADARLAPHERPRVYVVLHELPTTPSGKVRRDAVASLAAGALREGMPVGFTG